MGKWIAILTTARLDGLRCSMGVVAVFAVLALWFTRRLPGQPVAWKPDDSGPDKD